MVACVALALWASGKLPRHDRMKHRASFEVARQRSREGIRTLEHRLASRGPGRQCVPLTGNLACAGRLGPMPCARRQRSERRRPRSRRSDSVTKV